MKLCGATVQYIFELTFNEKVAILRIFQTFVLVSTPSFGKSLLTKLSPIMFIELYHETHLYLQVNFYQEMGLKPTQKFEIFLK